MKYVLGGTAVALVCLTLTLSATFYFRSGDNLALIEKLHQGPTTLLFTGDVMLGRYVETLMGKYGQDYPFKRVDTELKKVDGVIANLEGPLLNDHVQTPSGGMTFSFPASTPALLAAHNIKLVSLANNHTDDFGNEGFAETQTLLDKAGIMYVGNPFVYSATYIKHTTIGNEPFVFVAFNFTDPRFNIDKAINFAKSIKRDKKEFFVAMVHGGDEYSLTSNTRQQTFYRGLIDAGIDVVIAHHPHVAQEIELYNGKPIFYSLGNFIFDQYFSKDVEEGLAVKLTLSNTEAQYELMPVKGGHSQPYFMNETEKSLWLKNLSLRSSQTIQSDIQKGKLSITR